MKITFVHLDLGIGGAERLVVDAAVALQQAGHLIEIITSHHENDHCFSETKTSNSCDRAGGVGSPVAKGTLQVTVAGDWLPRSVFGKFYVVCSIVRMLYLALYICFLCYFKGVRSDLIFVDQVSHCIPLLRVLQVPIFFYCHYPDCLLVQKKSTLRNLYRWPIDRLEEYTTGLADMVAVNSHYTKKIFRERFCHLAQLPIEVLYPTASLCPDTGKAESNLESDFGLPKATFLSLNRYERKKDIGLALKALAYVLSIGVRDVHLVVAGGYDEAVIENVQYMDELRLLAKKEDIESHVTFLRSPTDEKKQLLIRECLAVLYTPQNEHFGIVPLEAMYMQKPVIATNTGGPLETVKHGVTGFLCDSTAEAFGEAMLLLLTNPNLAKEFGAAGRRRVLEFFAFEVFQSRLQELLSRLVPHLSSDL